MKVKSPLLSNGHGVLGVSAVHKKEIKKKGAHLLQQQHLFCDCRNVRRDTLRFALKCFSDMIMGQNYLKLNQKQALKLKNILLPFKTKVLRMADPKKRSYIMSKLTHQHGGGVVFTSLLAAVVPIISSLIGRLLKKKGFMS